MYGVMMLPALTHLGRGRSLIDACHDPPHAAKASRGMLRIVRNLLPILQQPVWWGHDQVAFLNIHFRYDFLHERHQ